MKANQTRAAGTPARIVRQPGVMGGAPVIEGTRIRVSDVHQMCSLYGSVVGVLKAYPHLSRAQVDAAISFYKENKAEIDAYIAAEDAIFEEDQRRQRSSS